MAQHNILGKAGEDAVKEFLICKGYTIRETNWRCGKLELDLVVQKEGVVIFVEVKTRTSGNFNPALAITSSKVRNIVNAAKGYLNAFGIPQLSIQIDIVYVIGQPGDFKIYHIENAIHPRFHSVRTRRY